MITINDITNAVAALAEIAFPGEPVYRNFVPADFQRPCTLVEITGGKFYPNASCGSVEIRPQLTLTAFAETDPYHQQDTRDLGRRQMILLGLFLPGYVKVKDRAPHVLDEGVLENGLDFASVTATLSFTLSRQEFMELQHAEDMGTLHIRQEVTTHG